MLAHVGTPIREGLEPFGAEYGQVFLDLPVPVDRTALGFGVSVSAVARPASPSRTRAQVRAAQLAHQGADHLAQQKDAVK